MAIVPTPAAFTAGEQLTAQRLNAVRDTAMYGTNKPVAAIRAGVPQTLPTSGATVNMLFNIKDFDNDGMWDPDMNTGLTARTAGIYRITGLITYTGHATGVRMCLVTVNGATVARVGTMAPVTSGPCYSGLHMLAVGDVVKLNGYQASGGSLATVAGVNEPGARLSLEWVSI